MESLPTSQTRKLMTEPGSHGNAAIMEFSVSKQRVTFCLVVHASFSDTGRFPPSAFKSLYWSTIPSALCQNVLSPSVSS